MPVLCHRRGQHTQECPCCATNQEGLDLSLCALFWSTLLISVAFSLIPLCYNLSLLAIVMVIAGMAMGVVETITNLQLVKIYQKDSAIFLQHPYVILEQETAWRQNSSLQPPPAEGAAASRSGLAFWVMALVNGGGLAFWVMALVNVRAGTGGAAAFWVMALVTGPAQGGGLAFWVMALVNVRAGTGRRPGLLGHGSGQRKGPAQGGGLAFWVMALLNLPVPLVVFILMYKKRLLPCSRTGTHLLDRRDPQEPEPFSSKSPPEEQQQCPVGVFTCFNVSKLRDRPPFFFLLHVLAGAILFCTDGITGAYTAFVFTYAETSPLKMSHHDASSLTSLFWASVTVGRLAFVYLSYRFPAVRLILLSLLGVVIVQSLLLIFYYSSVFLFVGTCLLGLCISSVFPCVLAYTEELLDYKGCAATVLVTSAGTGEMVLQVIVGSGIQHRGSYAFPLSNIIVAILAFGIFIVLLFLHHLHIKSQKEPSKDVATTDVQRSGGP
ncbi:unnamed protein product [Boreogadus saida]